MSDAVEPTNATGPRTPAGWKLRLEAWSFPAAFLAVFLILAFALGMGIPIRRVLIHGDRSAISLFALFAGVAAALSFVAMNARRAAEFFLPVRVGIAVLTFFLLGSILSVLVHPRDPKKDLNLPPEQQEAELRDDARWAHGFFLWSLLHPYGIGVPKFDVPNVAKPGLERIAQRYGKRIAAQEASGMKTAFSGKAKGDEIRAFNERHGAALDRFYEVCRTLQLNGTETAKGAWSSDWFLALMCLLFALVLTNTFRRGIARAIAKGAPGWGFVRALPSALAWDLRSLVSRERIGFLVTHLGVLTALTGGLASRLTEVRGVVQLSIDPARDRFPRESATFRTYDGGVASFGGSRPFKVRLANFRADYRDTLDLSFPADAEKEGKVLPRYRWFEVWKGHQIPLDFAGDDLKTPRIVVRVLEHWARADVTPDLRERTEGEEPRFDAETGPAVVVHVEQAMLGNLTALLHAASEEDAVLADFWGVRLRYEVASDAADLAARLKAPLDTDGETAGAIEVWSGGETPKRVVGAPIKAGSTFSFETASGPVNAEVLRFLPDARMAVEPSGNRVLLAEDATRFPIDKVPPRYPGVELRLSTKRKTFTRWVYEDSADENSFTDGSVEYGFVVHWDRWRAPARSRYRLITGPGLPVALARVGGGYTAELETGRPVEPEPGFRIELRNRADRPKVVPITTPLPGDADADEVFFDNTHGGAARIEVDGPKGKETFLVAAHPLARSVLSENGVRVTMFENRGETPREWKSRLELLEQDAKGDWVVSETGTIRVNDYLHYRGYRFFQTDANFQIPGYSGVGVVYDPGIETVLVGLWGVVIGVAYVFFLKPFLV
ncbi:MAG TPA: hypothetical protein VKE69_02095, partial [Planctomycetota bacterium]|nr:hypothetical protein [Planctomycetota bacterium]